MPAEIGSQSRSARARRPGPQLDIHLGHYADQGLGLWPDFTDEGGGDGLGVQGVQQLLGMGGGDGDEQAAGGLGGKEQGL